MAAFAAGFNPHTLDRACCDHYHYIEEHRSGGLVVDDRRFRPVKDRSIQQDLKLMTAASRS